jgi:hypothetical protein
VAYKRFVDNVPKVIDEQLVLGIAGLQDALATGLELDPHDAHERCVKWLTERPHIADKREKLVARQKRLSAAQVELLYSESVSSRIRVYLNSWVRLARRM